MSKKRKSYSDANAAKRSYGSKAYKNAKAQAKGAKQRDFGDGRFYRNAWLITGNCTRGQMVRGKGGKYHIVGGPTAPEQEGMSRRVELHVRDEERKGIALGDSRKPNEIGKWRPKKSTLGIC